MVDVDERRMAREAAERKRRIAQRVAQVVDYIFFVMYGVIIIRFLLTLIAANETAGFVRFVRALTQPLYGPFEGIVETPMVAGLTIDFPAIIALLIYMLGHIAVLGLLRLIFPPPRKD
jgi:uncharacterized protein YggT (Ycf19 family)